MKNLPQENIYGHTKKLLFILENINEYKRINDDEIIILDFGCGNGTAITQFIIQQGIKVYGIDIHDESLEYAEKNFGSENAFFSKEIPKDVLFDIIIYSDVLEHIENPEKILTEHNKILKKNGLILGSVPNGFGPFEIEKKITTILGLEKLIQLFIRIKRMIKKNSYLKEEIPYNFASGHVNFFTINKLNKLFNDCGFIIEKIEKGGFIGAPFTDRIFGKSKTFIDFNIKIAQRLPLWLVSTWYFKAKKIS